MRTKTCFNSGKVAVDDPKIFCTENLLFPLPCCPLLTQFQFLCITSYKFFMLRIVYEFTPLFRPFFSFERKNSTGRKY